MARPALIALQFLTCIPFRLEPPPTGREVGRSLLWYPAVGLLLGALLWMTAVFLRPLPAPLAAALVLAVWVALTGALHLDGLADTADAWVGGHGERARTLAIMKDPHVGPVAVSAIACLLLIKFGALSALFGMVGTSSWRNQSLVCGCIVPPLLARAAVPILFAHTPYLRAKGIGADLAQHQSRARGCWVAVGMALAIIALTAPRGLLAVAAAALTYLLVRRAFLRRLGGMTGDCIGAMIEVIEAAALVAPLLWR